MHPDVSIIIISYNTKQLLRNCIHSIYTSIKNISFEIVVVDNSSKDGSPEMIEAEFRDIKLIRNNKNLGFSKANNQAIKISRGKYLLLINSDAFVTDNCIESLFEFMDKHPKAAAVGPCVLSPDGTLQSKGFNFPSLIPTLAVFFRLRKLLPEKTIYRLFPKYYWQENDIRRVDWISGCCMLLRKEAADKIGSLSEDFFMYFEDQEWCYRANKMKYEIWYFPPAKVIHSEQSSSLSGRCEIEKLSRKIFYKKSIGLFKITVISIIDILSGLIKLLRSSVKPMYFGEARDTREHIKAQIENVFFFIK